MSQTTQKASGANATTGVGGTNAKQIGLGVKAGAINTAITTQVPRSLPVTPLIS